MNSRSIASCCCRIRWLCCKGRKRRHWRPGASRPKLAWRKRYNRRWQHGNHQKIFQRGVRSPVKNAFGYQNYAYPFISLFKISSSTPSFCTLILKNEFLRIMVNVHALKSQGIGKIASLFAADAFDSRCVWIAISVMTDFRNGRSTG